MSDHATGSSEHRHGDAYERAMARLEPYIRVSSDGKLQLEVDYESMDIPPLVYFDLKRSLEKTNSLIEAGEIRPEQIVGNSEVRR